MGICRRDEYGGFQKKLEVRRKNLRMREEFKGKNKSSEVRKVTSRSGKEIRVQKSKF
jgi:hypothetical protein